jgi:hypothetical protein
MEFGRLCQWRRRSEGVVQAGGLGCGEGVEEGVGGTMPVGVSDGPLTP